MWYTILPAMPPSFFLLIVTINLNNWSFYFIKIGEMKSSNQEQKQRERCSKLSKRIINTLTLFVCLVICGYIVHVIILGLNNQTLVLN